MTDNAKTDTRLPQLDLLRFLAAALVMLYHYVSSFPTTEQLAGTWLEPVAAVTRYGYLGVELFFIISGFVILWSSLNRSALSFAVSRAGRLFPSFWVAMLFAAACILLAPHVAQSVGAPTVTPSLIAANATMLPNVLGIPRIDGVYWTLEMEIRFYAIIFVLLLFKQMGRIELWLHIWFVGAAACALLPMPWIVRFAAIDPYGPLFIAGSFFYLLLSRGPSASRIIGVVLSGIAALAMSLSLRKGFITPDVESQYIVPAILATFFLIFSVLAWRPTKHFGASFAYQLGALTYPLYLIHGTAGRILFEVLPSTMSLGFKILILSVLALGLAYLMSVTVETYGRKAFDLGLKNVLRKMGAKV